MAAARLGGPAKGIGVVSSHRWMPRLLWVAIVALSLLVHGMAGASTDTGLVGDDEVAGPFQIGFPFRYYGQDFTEFYATTNGLVQFAGPSRAYANGCLPGAGLANTIHVFWDDLRTDVAGQPTGKIQYQTLGESPNRKLVVQWTNQYFFSTNVPMGTFQVVLFEGSGEVRMQYRFLTDARSRGSDATIGLQGPALQATQQGCNQTNMIAPEQALSFRPDSTGLNYVLDAAFPYDFLDISGLTPEAPAVAARYVNGPPSWSWARIPALNLYQVEIQLDDGTAVLSQVIGDVASFSWSSGFEPGRTYRARVRGSVNNGTTWELWSPLSPPVTVDQAPPTGQMLGAEQVGPTSVQWRYLAADTLSGVASVRLQIAADESFGTLVFNDLAALNGSHVFAAAVPGQRLYGRIQVTDHAGNVAAESAAVNLLVLPPPTADFLANPGSGEAPLAVTFQNTSSGVASSYLWDFGDGRTSSAVSPSMQFAQPGNFSVRLVATGVGGSTEVTRTLSVTPDVTVPAIGAPTVDGVPVGTTLLVNQNVQLSFTAADSGGVQTVSATLAGRVLAVTNLGGGSYRLAIDPLQYDDGTYALQFTVQDSVGNTATSVLELRIDLPPPVAPTLVSPAANLKTNQPAVVVAGTTPLGTEAQWWLNGVPQGDWVPVVNQRFETTLTVPEGANRIAAVVRNNRGTSPASTERVVTLDTSRPAAPGNLVATAQSQGGVRLIWSAASDTASVGTVVFRAVAPFDEAGAASRLTAVAVAGGSYVDLPATDGSYVYRVASVNALGTLSSLSNSAQVRVDSVAPRAVSVVYTPLGKVDAATGRIGQGRVNLVVTVSEPLQATPYLAIVPQGGAPIPIELAKTGDTTYAGGFLIDANTPSGVANALFSARDLVGNRGTDTDAGATLRIDTDGPALTAIVLNPSSPIKTEATPTVQARFSFSKPPKPGALPRLSYALSGPGRSAVVLGDLSQIDASTWQASFTLPADAGQSSPETLSFASQASDDLDNVSTRITAANRFQVYQGNLPPLNIPFGFSAQAQPAGKVRMQWQPVAEASAYQIYRQGPDDSELVALVRASGESAIDATPRDGSYKYAIATVRQSNGQESVSGQSAAVDVMASATAPGAPQNLALQLTGRGIVATWQPPLASNVAGYRLYRAAGTHISDITGLTPLKTGIKQPLALDAQPSPTQGAYVVTALDAAGNESAISNSAYLNASLLPVRDLKVLQTGSNLPVLTWASPNGNVAGYHVDVGPEGSKTRLTPSPISALSFTDSGYTARERRYTVSTVDANGVEMPRELLLPDAGTQVASGLPILRGVMNKLQVQVANTGSSALTNLRVLVRLPINKEATQFQDHRSEPIALGANQTQLVPVIVGGYADLPSRAAAQVGLEIEPAEGELIQLVRDESLDVGEGSLVVGMATEDFTRGGLGKLRLSIENTSEVDVELLTATNNGNNDSSELRFKILDGDGNVLATQAYKQVFGAGVVTLANGQTVARIPAGATYTSDVFGLNVPASSPGSVRIKLEVDRLRYHSGQDDQVLIAGRGSEKTVSLADTAYVGEVTGVSPLSSFGDQDVVITGQALERQGSELGKRALPNTRLKLILNQQGFERAFSVVTDGSGQFSYSFKPTLTDAGLYKVSAVHPDITDRPEQRAFTINRVTVGPTPYKLDLPRNYAFSIPFIAKAGAGTTAGNLRLVLDPASQPNGQLPAGIQVQPSAPVQLVERQALNIPAVFIANNDAAAVGTLVLDVMSDEHPAGSGAQKLGTVTVNYTLSESRPFLTASPSFVETGMAQGGSDLESVLVQNKGLQDALNLRFTLTGADGRPVPGWAAITSQPDGTLAVGEQRSVDISFTPPAGTAEDVYRFLLNVQGDNVPVQSMNVYASVTQSGQGNVFFKAADIYTATVDKNGRLIPGLAGTRVTVQNEDVISVTQELVTDSLGEALFQNLPAGRYKFRAQASNHQETGGRLVVKPGITANQSVFLDYNLVTVEWSVREVTIQDRYEITLNATFETDVPAAVIVMQPASVNLPRMNVGDVYYGELSLTNHGLIRADNVRQRLPANDLYFRYEFLVQVPETLEAKQRVTLPYRIVATQSLEDAANSANASGGGCWSYSNTTTVTCTYMCANKQEASTSAGANWFSVSNSSCVGVGGGGGGGWRWWGWSRRRGLGWRGGKHTDQAGWKEVRVRSQGQQRWHDLPVTMRSEVMKTMASEKNNERAITGTSHATRLHVCGVASRLLLSTVLLAGWVPSGADDTPQRLPIMEPADGVTTLTGAGASAPSGATGSGLTVSIPNGFATISVDDLRLQSVAGEVRWARTWDGQEWKFNPHWESLSQSWKNLTGSQTSDTTGASIGVASAATSGAGGCWVWVDEDWQPQVNVAGSGDVPDAGPMMAVRTTPFNRVAGESETDYPVARSVSVDYASLCVGSSMSGGSNVQDAEGIRRINELYLGEGGRYSFSNRTVLEKRPVRQLPQTPATAPYTGLEIGQLALAPQTNPKGWRWIERAGDWIDYNTQGQVVAYGDRNDNTVWLVRDSAGTLRGIVDAQGRVLATLHYTGQLITEVRDYPVAGLAQDLPARSVKYQYDTRNRLTHVTDVRGHTMRYEYDLSNRIVSITDALEHGEQLAYNGSSVSKHTAADGGVTDYLFEFDDVNKQFVSKITGPETAAGRRVEHLTHNRVGKLVRRIVNGRFDDEMRYDTGARIESHVNARGFTTLTTKNEFEQVVETAYADGAGVKRRYSALHLELTEETNEVGVKTQYQHDSKGNLLKKTEAAGTSEERITEYTRNSLGQITRITRKGRIEAGGSVTPDADWQIDYDPQGQIRKTTDPEGHVREFIYDRAGNLASATDPRGYTTRYEVDTNGNLLKAINALGHERLYSYDKAGNLVTQTDARGKSTLMAFDAMNRRTQVTNPVGGVFKTQYNGQGQAILETDEDGRINRIEYDTFLRITGQADALSNATQFGYEVADGSAAGRLGSLADPVEVSYPTFTQQTRMDERERPTRQILKNRNSRGEETLESAAVYDKRGLVMSETDANGHTRTHRHDALGQRIETTDALGGKTTSAYDARGNLLQVTDANGHVYRFEYDRNNRVAKEILPLGQTTHLAYDAAGNLTEKTDPRGHKFTYTYDAANRLTGINQTKADGSVLRTTTQTWDPSDNLITWTDTDATRPVGQQTTSVALTYDDAGRKSSESVVYPTPDGAGYVLGYTQVHSPAGKKTRLTWPDGTAIGYGYSLHGELESVTIPGEGTISVNQYKWTAPEKVTLPGGSTQNRSYDGLLNLEGFEVKTPGQETVLNLENQFGKVQELKSRSRTDVLGGVGTSKSHGYGYDAENRLRQVTGSEIESFTLDAVGNRIAHSRQAGAWIHDANNRLMKRGDGDCGSVGTVCYEYDEGGNRARKTEGAQVTQYRYDAMNRLSEVRDGQDRPVARYGYDPQDRRLWKEQYRDRDGSALTQALRTYYLYADEGLIAEATQAIPMGEAQFVTAMGRPAIATQYGPRPESEFTTGTLFMKTKNSLGQDTLAYYHHDHLQVPIQATDKAGNVVWAAEYSAFGRMAKVAPGSSSNTPEIGSNLRLPGQYDDQETGLYYNFRRYYDYDLGLYISLDPIGVLGGLNEYLYAMANPLLYVDSRGENAASAAVAIGLAIKAAKAAIQKCAGNKVCKCRAVYASYKLACGFPRSCKKQACGPVMDAKEQAAKYCYMLRDLYIRMNCDAAIPTRVNHPGERDAAKEVWEECKKKQAACQKCP